MVIGMPPGPAPLLTKTAIKKKSLAREQSKSFPERGEKCCASKHSARVRAGGKCYERTLRTLKLFFLLAGQNIAPGGRDAG